MGHPQKAPLGEFSYRNRYFFPFLYGDPPRELFGNDPLAWRKPNIWNVHQLVILGSNKSRDRASVPRRRSPKIIQKNPNLLEPGLFSSVPYKLTQLNINGVYSHINWQIYLPQTNLLLTHTNHSVKSLAKSSDMICVSRRLYLHSVYISLYECLQR